MSIRCSSTSLISGAIVCGVPGLGVLGSTILANTGSGGSGPGILFNDVQPGDESKEFRAEVLTWPSAGEIDLQEDGSFTYTGTASDALTYRLWVDGVSVGTASVALYGTAVGVAVDGAVDISWAASGSASATVIPLPVTASVGGAAAMAWAAQAAVSVTAIDPAATQADVSASAVMSWAATGAVSASILPPVAADVQGAATMAWAATGRIIEYIPSNAPLGAPMLSVADPTTFMSVAGR